MAVAVGVLAVSATSPPDDFFVRDNDTWVVEVGEGEVLEGSVTFPDGLDEGWQSTTTEVAVEMQPAPSLARLVLVDERGDPLPAPSSAVPAPSPLPAVVVDGTAHLGYRASCSERCSEAVGYRLEVLEAGAPALVHGEVEVTFKAHGEDEVPLPSVQHSEPEVRASTDDGAPTAGTEVLLDVDQDDPVVAVRVTVADAACHAGPTSVTSSALESDSGDDPAAVRSLALRSARALLVPATIAAPHDDLPRLRDEVERVVPLECGGSPDARTFWVVVAGGPAPSTTRITLLSPAVVAPEVVHLPPPASEVVSLTIPAGEGGAVLAHHLPDASEATRSLHWARNLRVPLPGTVTFEQGGELDDGRAELISGACGPHECPSPVELEVRRRIGGGLADARELTIRVEVLTLELAGP